MSRPGAGSVAMTPSFRLDGRRALVAGAGRGIGLAAAQALAQAGAEVTLAARTVSELEQAAAAIEQAGGRARVLALDVTDALAVQREVAARGPFQILVNSAGTNRPKLLADTTPEDIDAVLAVNIKAAFFCRARSRVASVRLGRPAPSFMFPLKWGMWAAPNARCIAPASMR